MHVVGVYTVPCNSQTKNLCALFGILLFWWNHNVWPYYMVARVDKCNKNTNLNFKEPNNT